MENRRDFIGQIVSGATLAGATASGQNQNEEKRNGIPYRRLGKTNEPVSVVGLGGFHMGAAPDYQTAERMVRTAIDAGINFMDNCWDYHNGKSEEWMGRALEGGYRKKALLMTKIDGRDRKTAAQQIDESLKRLRTDAIDVMQFHEIIRISEPHQVFSPGGAWEAMKQAKQAGKIRYIGFTGHKDPKIHKWMLKKAEENGVVFDTVQMPLNVMDAHYDSFEKQVLPELTRRNIGVLAMKPLGGGLILESGAKVTPVECLHYAMSLPAHVVITGCESMENLQQAIQAAKTFQPLSEQQQQDLLKRTAEAAANGRFELYKTSRRFDGTYENPQWLG